MNVGELFIKLGFDVDSQKIKDFQADINASFSGMLKLTAAATGALYALDKFVEGSIRNAAEMKQFSVVTGESIDQLQRWQTAATIANTAISVDQVTASISNLNKSLSDIDNGNGPSGPLAQLIGDVHGKNAFQVLEELRQNYQENVERWGLRKTNSLISDLGIDPGMISAIKLSQDEFNSLAEHKYLSQESLDRLNNLGKAMRSASIDFGLFKDQIAADISPELEQEIKALSGSFKELGGYIEDFLKWYLKLPGGEQAAPFVAFAVALAPELAVVASSLILLTAAVKDYDNYMSGRPSYIGNLVNKTADVLKPFTDMIAGDAGGSIHFDPRVRQRFLDRQSKDTPQDQYGIDITNVHSEAELDRLLGAARSGGMASAPTNVTVNNNVEIHSNGDPLAVGQEVQRVIQPSYNRTGAQLNNGPPY